jgi:hypothetical protein
VKNKRKENEMIPYMVVMDILESDANETICLHVLPLWDVTETDLVLAGPIWDENEAFSHANDMEMKPTPATLN